MFDVLAALILGFTYGIGPCTLACAPIVVPMIMSTARNRKEGLVHSFIFSIGRVFSYVVLGLMSGLLGSQIGFFPPFVLGIFLVLLGIAIMIKLDKKCLYKSNIKITGPWIALTSGIIYGFGPCPPLVALLALAAASKSAIMGAAMGLVFGIGTVVSPILVLGFFSGWFAKQKEFKGVAPYVAGGFLVIMGIVYILS